MEEEEEVVYLKIFDKYKGDVVFEGKVSTDVAPHELVKLGCHRERYLYGIYNKSSYEEVESFKGLQNNVELVAAGVGGVVRFSGVLYVGAEDNVLRKSKSVPSSECVMMSLWNLSHEECEKAFKCETLEVLEISNCQLRQIAKEIGKMRKLKKLKFEGLDDLKSIPEEIGELSSLKVLRIGACDVESLPKRLKDLKMLKSISLMNLSELRLNTDDLVVFSRLKHLTIKYCDDLFTPQHLTKSFWEMIESTTDLCVLEVDWYRHKQEMVVEALKENGSMVDGGQESEPYAHFFKRNKENHEKALQCVVQLLVMRRFRNALSNVPKEMVRMIAMMLLNTKCDINAWSKKRRASPIE